MKTTFVTGRRRRVKRHLRDDFRAAELPLEAAHPGGAEHAAHGAPDLARHA
jgi:hypothetical protein